MKTAFECSGAYFNGRITIQLHYNDNPFQIYKKGNCVRTTKFYHIMYFVRFASDKLHPVQACQLC